MWRRCAPSREAGIWGVFAFRTCELGGPGGVSAAHAQLVLQLLPLRLPPLHQAAEPGRLGLQPQQLHRYRHKDTDTRIQRHDRDTDTAPDVVLTSWLCLVVSSSFSFSSRWILLLLLLPCSPASPPPPADAASLLCSSSCLLLLLLARSSMMQTALNIETGVCIKIIVNTKIRQIK